MVGMTVTQQLQLTKHLTNNHGLFVNEICLAANEIHHVNEMLTHEMCRIF